MKKKIVFIWKSKYEFSHNVSKCLYGKNDIGIEKKTGLQ